MTVITEDIENLPPSAKFVVWVLEDEGELTQQDLIRETRLHQRTLRYALDCLEEEDIIKSRPNPSDARQSLYGLQR
ncbi:MarR family transcriptional regulator [Natrinema sp. CGMCC1.2065]|uniref:MarR family transcriptional regulator n=1 Tax=Natrinema sp. CGMCC1.2065 TaxID=3445767 RepID=UPI003F49DC87